MPAFLSDTRVALKSYAASCRRSSLALVLLSLLRAAAAAEAAAPSSDFAPDIASFFAAALAEQRQADDSNEIGSLGHNPSVEAIPKAPAAELHKVPIRKQYVPISLNNTVVAYKTAYFGEISLGSPVPQEFTVVFDTGSGHLILPASSCRSETCMKHRRFDRTVSNTALDIEYTGVPLLPTAKTRDQVSITFGTGKVQGEFIQDWMCLGRGPQQANGSDLTQWGSSGPQSFPAESNCVQLRVVLATDMSPEPFALFHFDGVLGLGLSGLALDPAFSFFGQLVAQQPSLQPRFAVFIARTDEGQSQISFGGHDEERAASEVVYAPVAMPELGYWQVRLKRVLVGDTVLEDCATGECRAILDTGTSLLGVPRSSARTMHRLLARPLAKAGPDALEDPSATDCRTVGGLQLTFEVDGGPVVTLGHEDYSRPKPFNMTMPEDPEGWQLFCRSLLLPVDLKPPLGPLVFIWGEPVLRRYYTVYDWASQQIGFAVAGAAPEADERWSGSIGAPPADSLAAGSPLRARAPASTNFSGGSLRGHAGTERVVAAAGDGDVRVSAI